VPRTCILSSLERIRIAFGASVSKIMTRKVLIISTVVLAVAWLSASPPAVSAPEKMPLLEKQKTEALIERVEALYGAVFIRDGAEYNAEVAARYLRSKWREKEPDVKTANEFVEKVGSISPASGKAYLIRLHGGEELASAEYLFAQLKEVEKASFDLWVLLMLIAASSKGQ
jgi:hypothetical protein